MARVRAEGEEALIRRIERIFPTPPADVRVPIGDDAALVRPAARSDWVLTTDQLVEGIHFRRVTHPPRLLGAKALTVNLSDLACLGADPRWFLLSLFLPRGLPNRFLNEILRGMAGEAKRRGVALVGGNITRSPVLAIDVCLSGVLPRGRRPLLRSGGSAGDLLYVSGTLGGSALGLELLKSGWRWRRGGAHRPGAAPWKKAAATRALRLHLSPDPPYQLASLLARRRLASAAIDLSDGLSIDLTRLCRASGVGASVLSSALPADPSILRMKGKAEAARLALHGGEEYQILFAVPPSRRRALERITAGHRFHRIGALAPIRRGIVLEGPRGSTSPLRPEGFDHLRILSR